MQKNTEVTILHFNDAYDIQTSPDGSLGFSHFYHYVQQLRQTIDDPLLIFSGDAFAPSKLSRALRGQQMVYCLNKLNIDIACYGNHDFDYDPDHALSLAKSCNFPWLMGNIKYIQTGKNIGQGLDYHIVMHKGIKIGYMGLAGPDFNGRLISPYHKKLKYLQITQYAKIISQQLIKFGCQLIIALTHARLPADQNLAKSVPEIDIILGGHDHSSIFKIINQIPIIKSKSNFECISIVNIFKEQDRKLSKDSFYGRRWMFESECRKVPKSTKYDAQIQKFISDSCLKFKQWQKNRMIKNNISQNNKQKIVPPKDDWLIEYSVINNRIAMTLTAGLSAQICFAKYIAFKKKLFYSGYKQAAPQPTPNFIAQTLQFIYKQIKSHQNNGKTVLYSPGICNVPYIVQTGNVIYLPSHFLVGIDKMADLQQLLEVGIKAGYKCYAVVGFDSFINDKLCAWIKFTEPPRQYIDLMIELQIKNVMMMSVHDVKKGQHGHQRSARLFNSKFTTTKQMMPLPKDIYIIFMRESYGKTALDDIKIFNRIIKDVEKESWFALAQGPICEYIYDWESGIDCISTVQTSLSQHLNNNVKYYYIVNQDSWKLYLTAYYIGKEFIKINFNEEKHPVKAKGIVFNQYFFSNPTYQLNYGYIPILYWQFYPNNEARILSILSQDQKNMKRWFNMHKATKIQLINKDSTKITSDNQGKELLKWITKYAPQTYELNYLPLNDIIECLKTNGLLLDKLQ